jgi:hypothetical protein
VIRRTNDALLDKLYRRRSDVIHYRADTGGFTVTETLGEDSIDLTVYAPRRLVQVFHELRALSKQYRLTLRYVALWLTGKAVQSATEIVQGLVEHVEANRRFQPGEEPFQFRPRAERE